MIKLKFDNYIMNLVVLHNRVIYSAYSLTAETYIRFLWNKSLSELFFRVAK